MIPRRSQSDVLLAELLDWASQQGSLLPDAAGVWSRARTHMDAVRAKEDQITSLVKRAEAKAVSAVEAAQKLGMDHDRLNNNSVAEVIQIAVLDDGDDPDWVAEMLGLGVEEAKPAKPASGPHVKVEFDRSFFGGGYDKVGEFAYLPVSLVEKCKSVERAFRTQTGLDPEHIVHCSEDEWFDAEGKPWPEDGEDTEVE